MSCVFAAKNSIAYRFSLTAVTNIGLIFYHARFISIQLNRTLTISWIDDRYNNGFGITLSMTGTIEQGSVSPVSVELSVLLPPVFPPAPGSSILVIRLPRVSATEVTAPTSSAGVATSMSTSELTTSWDTQVRIMLLVTSSPLWHQQP